MQRGFSVPSFLCVLNDKCGIIPMLASAACGAAAGGSSPRQDPSPLDPPPPDRPKFRAFFSLSRPHFRSFYLSLWGSSRVFLSLSGKLLVSFFISLGVFSFLFFSLWRPSRGILVFFLKAGTLPRRPVG